MSRGRVLVVEDDTDIRETIVEVLAEHGYTSAGAVNGVDALRQLSSELEPRPGLILLDLMMPVMNGRELTEVLQRTPTLSAIPVVLLSAYRDVAELAAGMGTVAQLHKPIDLNQLLRVVEEHYAKA